MSKLILQDLSKEYNGNQVVDKVSLEMQEGEFVSLLGPSGCGKTTTLRMIAGFMSPSAGTISMDGKVISSASGVVQPEQRQMSMIFQSYAIWPNMTVAENVAFGLQVRKLAKDEINRRVTDILTTVKLIQLKDRYPSELSGGQQQRVALARAVVIEPQVLLLDEPLSNLDANLREEMRFEIRRLHDRYRITTVYVTHDQSEAMTTSDRIVVMNKGRIEQVDPPYALYNQPRTSFVAGFIGRTNLLQATFNGDLLDYDGFAVPAAGIPAFSGKAGQALSFSLRPQDITLSRTPVESNANRWNVAARIVDRSYVGEYWDYFVQPGNGTQKLRVSTPPSSVFEVGDTVWLDIAPSSIIQLQD